MTRAHQSFLIAVIVLFLVSLSCGGQEDIELVLCEASGGTWTWDEGMTPWDAYCHEPTKTVVGKQEETQSLSSANATQPSPANGLEPTVQPTTHPGSANSTIFIGTTTIWEGFSGGQIVEDEIYLIIGTNGEVNGSLISIYQESEAQPQTWEDEQKSLHSCITQQILKVTGVITGKLTEGNNLIQMDLTYDSEIVRHDCPSTSETLSDNIVVDAEVNLIDTMLVGSVPDWFTFEAYKQ